MNRPLHDDFNPAENVGDAIALYLFALMGVASFLALVVSELGRF